MTRRWYMNLLVIALAIISVGAIPSPSEAALLDWLFPFREQRQARRWAYYNNYAFASGMGTTTAFSPTMGGGTAATTSYFGGFGAGGPTFGSGNYYPGYGSWFRPTTAYRTVWAPVPVTSYRPTVDGNSLQVCNSHSWQARRVPFTAFQPTIASAGVAPGPPGCTSCGTAMTAFSVGANSMNDSGWRTVSSSPLAAAATMSPRPDAGSCANCSAPSTATTAMSVSDPGGWMPVAENSPTSGGCATCSVQGTEAANTYASYRAAPPAGSSDWRPIDSPAMGGAAATGSAAATESAAAAGDGWRPFQGSSLDGTASEAAADTAPVLPPDMPRQETERPLTDGDTDADADGAWRPINHVPGLSRSSGQSPELQRGTTRQTAYQSSGQRGRFVGLSSAEPSVESPVASADRWLAERDEDRDPASDRFQSIDRGVEERSGTNRSENNRYQPRLDDPSDFARSDRYRMNVNRSAAEDRAYLPAAIGRDEDRQAGGLGSSVHQTDGWSANWSSSDARPLADTSRDRTESYRPSRSSYDWRSDGPATNRRADDTPPLLDEPMLEPPSVDQPLLVVPIPDLQREANHGRSQQGEWQSASTVTANADRWRAEEVDLGWRSAKR